MTQNRDSQLRCGKRPFCHTLSRIPKSFLLRREKISNGKENAMSKSANKNERLIFRVSPYEKTLTINKARRAKISVSDFCRKAVLEKEVRYIEGLDKLTYDLGKIGTNINQIAVAANQGRDVSKTIPAITTRLFELFDKIEKAIGGDTDCDSQTD